MGKNVQITYYDRDWIQLMKEAKNIGLTPAEVRVHLNKVKKRSECTS